MSDAAIERRQGDALSQIVGTGDTRAALATLEQNVRDIIDVARERGFVTTFERDGRKTDFYGFPAWQILAATYGVTPLVKDVDPIDGGFKAHAIAQTRDGQVVGEAFAICQRSEPKKQNATGHTLLALASTRAMRNALRGAFGSALVLAGFDFPDPDAPATNDQVAVLHILEREIGWDHDQGHVEAGGIASYRDLTREAASEVIERWTALRDESVGGREADRQAPRHGAPAPSDKSDAVSHFPTSDAGELGSSSEQGTPEAEGYGEGPEASGGPDLNLLWQQAIELGFTPKKAPAFAKANGIQVEKAYELTLEQMLELLPKWQARK